MMILNETQKQEVADYVSGITRYIETYNEIYDHVLSALEQEVQESFQIGLVSYIIDKDFGGSEKIEQNEEGFRNSCDKSFQQFITTELLNAFQFSRLRNNIAFIVLSISFYFGNSDYQFKETLLLISMLVLMVTPILLYLFKIWVKDRSRIKPSISNHALRYVAFIGMQCVVSLYFFLFAKGAIFILSPDATIITMLGIYFLFGIYLRAYIKIYRRSLRSHTG